MCIIRAPDSVSQIPTSARSTTEDATTPAPTARGGTPAPAIKVWLWCGVGWGRVVDISGVGSSREGGGCVVVWCCMVWCGEYCWDKRWHGVGWWLCGGLVWCDRYWWGMGWGGVLWCVVVCCGVLWCGRVAGLVFVCSSTKVAKFKQ